MTFIEREFALSTLDEFIAKRQGTTGIEKNTVDILQLFRDEFIQKLPTANAVHRAVLDAVVRERDQAVTKLREYKKLNATPAKMARWENRGYWAGHNCSYCGALNDIDTNFCPNCGAKMLED